MPAIEPRASVVFMGTPAYAVPALRALVTAELCVLAVTQPDRPAGRGRRLTPSPVRVAAEGWGVPVLTPRRLGPRTLERLQAFRPRLILTAAYGGILSRDYLGLAERGCFNLHASLLPRWRGPNPIAWAIRAGDRESGVTLMAMDAGVDTGPIVGRRVLEIAPDDTTGSLGERLALAGADLLTEWLPRLLAGDVPVEPQTGTPTMAPKFGRTDAHVGWGRGAAEVAAAIRSLLPDPGPWMMVDGERILILDAAVDETGDGLLTGHIERRGDAWRIGCGAGALGITLIRPAGRRAMTPGAYVRGRHREVSRVE